MEFQAQYQKYLSLVEEALAGYFQENAAQKTLLDAMKYSLMAGGKRIRPVLALAFCEMACGEMEPALAYGCGVEMLHTYSLIHDDLPCMDDDDLRRGKPSCHKQFDECTATLAGDALQAYAFGTLAGAEGQTPQSRAHACLTLATAVGPFGMCGGQYLDMAGEGNILTVEELSAINEQKTAALLEAACVLGLLAGGVPLEDERMVAGRRYAQTLGLAFQLQDDILDATSTTEVLGKPVGSDAENQKNTYVALLGLSACEALVLEQTNRAKEALAGTFENSTFLCALADTLATRKK